MNVVLTKVSDSIVNWNPPFISSSGTAYLFTLPCHFASANSSDENTIHFLLNLTKSKKIDFSL